MQLNVMDAIRDGFKAANKSWAGIGVYAGVWAGLILVTAGGLLLTNPPAEIFKSQAEEMVLPAPGEAVAAEPAPAGDAAVTEQPAATEAFPAADADTFEDAPEPEDEALGQATLDWLSRAWPMALLCGALLLVGSAWAQAGQLGYIAKALGGQARVADFWQTGAKAFRAVLAAMALMMLADILGRAANAVLDAIFQGLSQSAPEAVLALLGVLILAGTVPAIIWLAVRLSFWFPAIVVSGLGPIAALRDSFRVTRRRWWRVAALRGVMLGITLAGVLAYGIIVALAGLLGDAIGAAALLAGTVALLAALLYGSFAFAGADIRFYQQARQATA